MRRKIRVQVSAGKNASDELPRFIWRLADGVCLRAVALLQHRFQLRSRFNQQQALHSEQSWRKLSYHGESWTLNRHSTLRVCFLTTPYRPSLARSKDREIYPGLLPDQIGRE